ncbi:MAG TPA: hypothetical protein VFI69_05850 [Candidatus Limnocylindrales bacterium]|jgi:hypothetical protein|nr:hypothetical protein [Candidatus Limnocylindrales bacterium]
MGRILALVVLIWGLLSCQPDGIVPGSPSVPTLPPPRTPAPGLPSPTIEIPPPI